MQAHSSIVFRTGRGKSMFSRMERSKTLQRSKLSLISKMTILSVWVKNFSINFLSLQIRKMKQLSWEKVLTIQWRFKMIINNLRWLIPKIQKYTAKGYCLKLKKSKLHLTQTINCCMTRIIKSQTFHKIASQMSRKVKATFCKPRKTLLLWK